MVKRLFCSSFIGPKNSAMINEATSSKMVIPSTDRYTSLNCGSNFLLSFYDHRSPFAIDRHTGRGSRVCQYLHEEHAKNFQLEQESGFLRMRQDRRQGSGGGAYWHGARPPDGCRILNRDGLIELSRVHVVTPLTNL